MKDSLPWPLEQAAEPASDTPRWMQADSNIVLDFHGDPLTAELVVFSDGNHHMALMETLTHFKAQTVGLNEIFYATTPPGVLVNLVQNGSIQLGNLSLSRQPHVFISPEFILDKLAAAGITQPHQPFMQSCGNVMLVRQGNPKGIKDFKDLLREDVKLFLSNPKTEKASYDVYTNTLSALSETTDISNQMQTLLGSDSIVYGERIHHREAPQCVYEGTADVAIVYYHLALRYTRIFPNEFEIIPLGGGTTLPPQEKDNELTTYFMSEMKDPGEFGKSFIEFCKSGTVKDIYNSHGLTGY